jgi:predicted Rossmann fold flavoprotein
LGHAIETPVPSLFTFTTPDRRLKGLAGITVNRATLALSGTPLRQTGTLLITHWGLSGPAVLLLSAWGARTLHDRHYRAPLEINWLSLSAAKTEEILRDYKTNNPRKTVVANALFDLPHRLWEQLAAAAGLNGLSHWADVSKQQIKLFTNELSGGRYEINGKSEFKEEFVTCGGVRLDEVDFKTMESKICPNLYFAGEILDVDGVTGGFNFQNAWTTAWVAGHAMGETIE